MDFESPTGRRIIRLERQVKELIHILNEHHIPQQSSPQQNSPQHSVYSTPVDSTPTVHPYNGPHTKTQQPVKRRKIYNTAVFDSIGGGEKRLTLHHVTPLAQAVARAKKLLTYKRKNGKVLRRKHGQRIKHRQPRRPRKK